MEDANVESEVLANVTKAQLVLQVRKVQEPWEEKTSRKKDTN